jgi:hypothetical protein
MRTRDLLQAAIAGILSAGTLNAAAAPGDVYRISEDAFGNPGTRDSHTWRSSVNHLSDDGRYLALYSTAPNLTGELSGFSQILVHDRTTGALDVVSRKSVSVGGTKGNGHSYWPSVSANGRYVAFTSYANNLDNADPDVVADVYVYDRDTDTLELASRKSADAGGAKGNNQSLYPAISADGRYVAFESAASNFDGGAAGYPHIYVYDHDTDTLEPITPTSAFLVGNGNCSNASISADGRYVAFQCDGILDAADHNFLHDIYVYDRNTDTVELVSRKSASAGGAQGNFWSYGPAISASGRYVAFYSYATNLVSDDTDGNQDVYVYDRDTDTLELVSRQSAAAGGIKGNNHSNEPSISADGRYVAFRSSATNLDSSDTDSSVADIYTYDRTTGTVYLMSKTASGNKGNNSSMEPVISPNGALVAFTSYATNLDGPQVFPQVFLKETGLSASSSNNPPTANAGTDQTVEATSPSGSAVNLDGSASFDPDTGDGITVYHWSGPFGSASGVTPAVSLPLGTHTVVLNVTDGHGATDDDTVIITVVDTTPPIITCPANVTGTVGQAVNLGNPTVSDYADASPAVTNNAPANFAAGPTTVTWSATDEGGNSASCTQVVTLTYHFQGFLQPVDNPPIFNSVKSGATVPVKWRLLDAAGNYVSDTSAATEIKYVSSACGGTEDAIEETVPTGGTGLRWDSIAQQFIYNWKTPSLPGKCLRLDIRFADGNTKSVNFKLK